MGPFSPACLGFTSRNRLVCVDNTDAFELGNKYQNQRPLLRQRRDCSIKQLQERSPAAFTAIVEVEERALKPANLEPGKIRKIRLMNLLTSSK